jgi:hypothetical protein
VLVSDLDQSNESSQAKNFVSEEPFPHNAASTNLIPDDWRLQLKKEPALVLPFSIQMTHDILLRPNIGRVFSIITLQDSSPKEMVHACASTVDHDGISLKKLC